MQFVPRLSAAALAICLLGGEGVAEARPGALDPSFGSGGIAATGVPAGTATAVVLQPDGKIVVAVAPTANGGQTPAFVRLLPGGGLDPSFGSGGVAPLELTGFPFAAEVTSAALQPDGKIVFCGGGLPLVDAPAFTARIDADGSPDPSFGNGGTVLNVVPYAANVVLLDADGDVVTGGGSTFAAETAVARLTPGGAFDPFFGSGGIATFSNAIGAVYALGAQADGKYLALGTSVIRLDSDGAIDRGYGGGGVIAAAHDGNASFSKTGKVLATVAVPHGRNGSSVQTARYLRSGAADASFSSPLATFGYGAANVPAYLHQAAGGEIVVDGASTRSSGAAALGLVRYHPDGSLDTGFGTGGALFTRLGTQLNAPGEFAIDGRHGIVVTAVAVIGGVPTLVVARYLWS